MNIANEPWTRTPDRSVWRACRGGLVLTVTRLAAGGWRAVVEGHGVTERSLVKPTRLEAQRWADSRAGTKPPDDTSGAAAAVVPPLGPFETELDAIRHPAVQAIYAAMRASTRRGVMAEEGRRMLAEACEAAGVELGAYDHRIILWLAGFEPAACAVVAGLIARASRRGAAAGREVE
jgi:hypothetical protein